MRNYELELRNSRPKEQEFLENHNANSQMSSIDFLQPRTVSTGLGWNINLADRLRQAVLEKVQTNEIQIISHVEDKFIERLREKQAMVENINKKNMELEIQVEELAMKADTWQQRAKYNKNMINTLKYNLQ
ncbi:putative E3 ubiquitin-protein ligase BOI [Helianthus annuus]|uniref:E3 ubiquitin-protein ligase BOI n=1 Tax=Helianthus annuus TaxID=4232 RepID=A0A9K3IP85_HELAN|nr:putative E3 ubiquitin-protein ligase BOI [Helianthus annuus]